MTAEESSNGMRGKPCVSEGMKEQPPPIPLASRLQVDSAPSDCKPRRLDVVAGAEQEIGLSNGALHVEFGARATSVSARSPCASSFRAAARDKASMYERFYQDSMLLATTLRRLDRAPISQANRQAISQFATAIQAEGLSKLRVVKYVGELIQIAKIMPCDFVAAESPVQYEHH